MSLNTKDLTVLNAHTKYKGNTKTAHLFHKQMLDTRAPTLPENQPTGGCPYGYADWCLAREIVKTVKTAASLLP